MSWEEATQVHTPPVSRGEDDSANRQSAYLVVLAGTMMGEMYPLARRQTVIGRGQRADVRILDDGISREHCEIVVEDGIYILRDMGSTNGTFCKGVGIKSQKLDDGDKILVGTNTVLKFTFHDKLDETFQRQMYESALRDELTKGFNKKYFMDRIESEVAYALRHNVPLTLVTFDLDHFKNVNDTFGHLAGDYVLSEVAGIVLGSIRVEDVFARVGGEEFCVICRGTDEVQGLVVAERLRRQVDEKLFEYAKREIPVSISVGMATIPGHDIKDAVTFIGSADKSLYDAKHGGRNRVCVFKA